MESLFPNNNLSDRIDDLSWMSYIPDERFINEINIPGTHDSCTKSMANLFVEIYAKTQCNYLMKQLESGFRFLDLRVTYEPNVSGKLTLSHDKYFCRTNEDHFISLSAHVIKDIAQFLANNPSETIILAIGYEYREKELYSKYMMEWWNNAKEMRTSYGDKPLFYWDNEIPRLGEVRGRIVLVRRRCFTYGDKEWNELSNTLGINLYRLDNQSTFDEDAPFYIENHYDLPPDEKKYWIRHFLANSPSISFTDEMASKSREKIRVCFSSSNKPISYGPKGIAEFVNKEIKYTRFEKGRQYGWWLLDFAEDYRNCKNFFHIPAYILYMSNVFVGEESKTYISELWVAVVNRTTGQSDRQEAMSLLMKNRMYIDGKDISAGKGKKFIIMGHKISGIRYEGITGLAAVTERGEIYINGWKWYPVKGNDQTDVQDLNRGTGNDVDVFLHYTKDPRAGAPITEIRMEREEVEKDSHYYKVQGWDSACWYYTGDIANLKTNTGYDYIYCLFRR